MKQAFEVEERRTNKDRVERLKAEQHVTDTFTGHTNKLPLIASRYVLLSSCDCEVELQLQMRTNLQFPSRNFLLPFIHISERSSNGRILRGLSCLILLTCERWQSSASTIQLRDGVFDSSLLQPFSSSVGVVAGSWRRSLVVVVVAPVVLPSLILIVLSIVLRHLFLVRLA